MEITANDEPTEIEADVDKRFSSIIVNLPVRQTGTGTPSPSNPRPFTTWTDVSLYVSDTEEADDPTLSIELPTPMYGGKVDMIRGEIATTYNSKESGTGWEMTEEGQFRCQVSAYNNGDETSTDVADLYAVHYDTVSNKDAYDATDDLTCGLATIAGTTYLYVNDAQYTTLESFATHIADEVFVFRAHIPMSDVTEPHIVYLPEGTSYVWADAGFVDYTVSGTPPLSLPNSLGKPLKAWEVALSPFQDLHGYDNPWPAGGGKNIADPANVLHGYYSVQNPRNFVSNEAYRTLKQTLSAGTYTFTTDLTDGRILRWAIDDTNTSTSGSPPLTFTIETEGVVQICFRNKDTTDITEDFNVQLEVGSTATDYAPYTNICPIYGTDKVNVVTTGKNLMGLYVLIIPSAGNTGNLACNIPAGTYTFAVTTNRDVGWTCRVRDADGNDIITPTSQTSVAGRQSVTFTITQNASYINVYFDGATTATDFQLELGSTATDFVPYVAPSSTVINIIGKNKFGPNATPTKSSFLRSTGQLKDDTSWNVSDYIAVTPSTQYTFNPNTNSGSVAVAGFYTDTKEFISSIDSGLITFTTPNNCYFMRFSYRKTSYDIQLELGDSATEYERFVNIIYGGTYDAVTGQGTIKRVEVDSGDLSWGYNENYFQVAKSSLALPALASTSCVLMHEVYPYSAQAAEKSMTQTTSYIRIYNSDYSDAQTFTASVSGKKLVYELATPIPFTTDGHTIKLPKGTATTWATAEDGTVDSMEVTYIGKA